MRHIPDAVKATSEMRRVTRPGGVVATAMWDNTGGHRINQSLWDTAGVLDTTMKFPPKVSHTDPRRSYEACGQELA